MAHRDFGRRRNGTDSDMPELRSQLVEEHVHDMGRARFSERTEAIEERAPDEGRAWTG